MPVEPLHASDPPYLGPYRLAARLGAGGMGVVYLADTPSGPVAVKTLRRELADQPELRARFAREITVLQQVGGACTVRVLDARMDVMTPYLVTEYVPGPTLESYVTSQGPLPANMLRPLAVGLAEALVAIHAAGVVHRDLKPSNVILGPNGPKVIDFGIAQLSDAVSLTRAGLIVGSATFMAPEQVQGRPGAKADIFTWAIAVAFACQGRPPFGEGPSEAVLYRTMNDEPDLRGVPDEMVGILRKALVKDPATRPGASEVLAELTGRAAESNTDAPTATRDETRQFLSRTWMMPAPAFPPPQPPQRLMAGPPPRRPPLAFPRGQVPPWRWQPRPGQPPRRRTDWMPVALFGAGLVLLAALVVGGLVLVHQAGNGTAGGPGTPSTTPTTAPSGGASRPSTAHTSHRPTTKPSHRDSTDGQASDQQGGPPAGASANPSDSGAGSGGAGGVGGGGGAGGGGAGGGGPSAANRQPFGAGPSKNAPRDPFHGVFPSQFP